MCHDSSPCLEVRCFANSDSMKGKQPYSHSVTFRVFSKYSIVFPCITHGYSAVVVPGIFEWPLSERTPVKCSVSDEPGCWPGDANPGKSVIRHPAHSKAASSSSLPSSLLMRIRAGTNGTSGRWRVQNGRNDALPHGIDAHLREVACVSVARWHSAAPADQPGLLRGHRSPTQPSTFMDLEHHYLLMFF